MKLWTLVAAMLLVCTTWSGTASAQSVPGPATPPPIAPPPGEPPAVVQPGLGVWVVRDENNFDASFLAYDFHFTDTVSGWSVNWGDGQSSSLLGVARSASHAYQTALDSLTRECGLAA